MKNKILFLMFMLLLLPINVLAKEEIITISCDNKILENNNESECKINAENLSFTTTSITGQIVVSDNLEIVNSNYDDTIWKMLDSKFDVRDINLISEKKDVNKTYTIATFKIKAINKSNSTGEIKFINVSLGDEVYESHDIEVDKVSLSLNYDNTNEEVGKNPSTKDLNIIIPVICIIILFGYCAFLISKRRENN